MTVPEQATHTNPATPPKLVSLESFVDGIRQISEGVITKQIVSDYLAENAIEPSGFEKYKHWEPDRHTRNLIFRNPLIEVMLICWNIGNRTPLHTHNGQLGWMEMIEGRLKVENFRHIACNKPENQEVVGFDCLAGATSIELAHMNDELVVPGGALNTVDKSHTIHRISNPAEWNERAVSMHIYSLPIDSCVTFDLEAQRCYRRDLKYDY